MNLEVLFTTPIFHEFLDLNLTDLEDYAYRLYGQSDGRKKSNRLGWQSNDIETDEELSNLISKINNCLTQVQKFCNLKPKHEIVVSNLWVNINKKHSYNLNHIHTGSFFSGCFYIKVPEESGRINFENPSKTHQIFTNNFNLYTDNLNEFTAHHWTYDPKPNLLLLFPSWIEHNVDQNLSNEDRISFAFNTRILFT